MASNKELQVSAIKNGTVIDHIPNDQLFNVINVLGLQNYDSAITFGKGYESSKLTKKGIIKISDKFLCDEEVNKLALVSPSVKINIIKDYEVVEKKIVNVPDFVEGIVRCVNPKCITNHEQVTTKFKVVNKEHISLKCHYCEKITDKEHIETV